MYQHRFSNDQVIDLPVGKVVCVGRNYSDHIRELNNSTPATPVLFMKPREAICDMHSPIKIPQGKCHNELEVALLIGKPISSCSVEQCMDAVMGIGLGLDLTLRDLQNRLKQAGHPWERAKAFDNSCPLSKFVQSNRVDNWQNIDFTLILNQQVRQQGSTKNMLFPIAELLIEITRNFSLSAGDVVLTGTPSGVGPLRVGDEVQAELGNQIKVKTNII